MPTQLTGLDASFLYLETRTSHMHVGGVIILDPSDVPERFSADGMRDYLDKRLHLAPPFRRRLLPVPLRVDHPVWIEDPEFDLDNHVRRAALPAPGGGAELAQFVGDFMSRPLDRDKPLWEAWVVEGLEGGRIAFVSKTHHAAIDGVSGAELLAAMLQLDPDDEPDPPERQWVPEELPSEGQLLLRAGARLALRPWQLLGAGRRVLSSLGGVLDTADAQGAAPPAPFTAPMTPLNGTITARRRVAFAEVRLDDVKEIKNRRGGTVNDVVLAAVAGGLRSYLQHRGHPADEPLVGMVPVSTHEGEGELAGNQVSMMLVALPVHRADPLQRLREVSVASRDAKEQHGALGATTIQQLVELAPAGVSSLAARAYTTVRGADHHRPIWNVIVSNVPGPRFELFMNGAKVEALYPIGPVHDMVGLNITLFSYLDTIFIGCNADRQRAGDVDVFARALRESIDELAKAVRG